MQEKESSLQQEDTKESNQTETEEEKVKILINKKIVIKGNDYEKIKDTLDSIKLNESYLNKIAKNKPFIAPEILHQKFAQLGLEDKEISSEGEDSKYPIDTNNSTQLKLPSGIVQIAYKSSKEAKSYSYKTDYSGMNSKVYDKFKNNITRELDILIGNAGIIFNKSPIMDKIVTKKIEKKYLLDRIYIWQYYIKTLDDTEKIKLVRNFLYRLKLFFKKCYEELMNINKIKNAYMALRKTLNNIYDEKDWNEFFLLSKIFGYTDVNTLKNELEKSKSITIKNKIELNIISELNGSGAGLLFIGELGNFSNMCLYSLVIIQLALGECFELLKPDFEENYIRLHCVMFKYFDMFILSHSFVQKMFVQLLLIYSTYKQEGLVENLHKLLIAKFNAYDELEKLEISISKRIGNDVQYDEEKKIDEFKNLDELVNYIESDKSNKKKKKKKKKHAINNQIDELCKIYKEKNFGDNFDEDIYEGNEIPDNISVMSGISEADSIVRAFKCDVKKWNFSGEKLKANLSENFMINLNEY